MNIRDLLGDEETGKIEGIEAIGETGEAEAPGAVPGTGTAAPTEATTPCWRASLKKRRTPSLCLKPGELLLTP